MTAPGASHLSYVCSGAEPRRSDTLLIGMGNPILSDDAVGVRLARACRQIRDIAEAVDVLEECSVGGLNLLDVVAGYRRLIIFDSIKTADGVCASWYRFTARALRETMNLSSVHDINFATTLELGRRMGMTIPDDDDIHIFAVEVDDNVTFSERMTPALEAAFPRLVRQISAEVVAAARDKAVTQPQGRMTEQWR